MSSLHPSKINLKIVLETELKYLTLTSCVTKKQQKNNPADCRGLSVSQPDG